MYDNLVISFTTFPARIGQAHRVVSSLLRQSASPQKIVLYLSLQEFPDRSIPSQLAALTGARFEIRYVRENLRPYNKLIFALADFPDTMIVTCDDDRILPPHWLSRLCDAAAATPGVVVSTLSRRMIAGSDGGFARYSNWPYNISGAPTFRTMPLGTYGVLYPPRCFHAAVQDRALIARLAPLQDDIWFKMMNILCDAPCRSVGFARRIGELEFQNNVRLWDRNVAGGLNDLALMRALKHFALTVDDIRAKEDRLGQRMVAAKAITEPLSLRRSQPLKHL